MGVVRVWCIEAAKCWDLGSLCWLEERERFLPQSRTLYEGKSMCLKRLVIEACLIVSGFYTIRLWSLLYRYSNRSVLPRYHIVDECEGAAILLTMETMTLPHLSQ
jgi:hypothetical protein